MSILDTRISAAFAEVFVQTNEQGTSRVPAFRRGEDGALESRIASSGGRSEPTDG